MPVHLFDDKAAIRALRELVELIGVATQSFGEGLHVVLGAVGQRANHNVGAEAMLRQLHDVCKDVPGTSEAAGRDSTMNKPMSNAPEQQW